jgi:hypothetical protein
MPQLTPEETQIGRQEDRELSLQKTSNEQQHTEDDEENEDEMGFTTTYKIIVALAILVPAVLAVGWVLSPFRKD